MKKMITLGVVGGLLFGTASYALASSSLPMPIVNKGDISQTEQIPAIKITPKIIKTNSESLELDLKIPVLIGLKNIQLQNKINNALLKNAMLQKSTLEKEALEYVKEAKKEGWPIHPYQFLLDCTLLEKENILSFAVKNYIYTGGANGMYNIDYYNIDLSKNDLFTLKDLFKENVDYKDLLNKKIKRQIVVQEKFEDKTFFSGDMGFASISDTQSFYVKEGQLVICFGLYEIAPRSTGIVEIKIPVKELKGLLKDQYCDLLGLNTEASYKISDEFVKGENAEVYFPQIKNFKGQLIMDYINQDLKNVLEPAMREATPQSKLSVDYEITRQDENILSVVFKGAQQWEGGQYKILKAQNFDLKTSNQISAKNLIKKDETSQRAINQLLTEAAKNNPTLKKPFTGFGDWMGVYFTDKNLVFYYIEDDSATDFVQLEIPLEKALPYLNTSFGEMPVS